jgi:thioredoxin-like negative regulator of GroEL
VADTEYDTPDLQAFPAAKLGQPDAEPVDDGQDAKARLSPREVRFVDALATGESGCQAAKLAGISDRTGRRWRQRHEIQAAIRSRLNDSLGSARAILAQGSARAARSLVDMSDGESDATSPKVAASRAVIEQATALTSIEDLESRLAELEAAQGKQAGAPGFQRRIGS